MLLKLTSEKFLRGFLLLFTPFSFLKTFIKTQIFLFLGNHNFLNVSFFSKFIKMTTNYITFEAEIKQNGTMNAAFVDFPFSTEELFGKKGQVKIKALLDEKVEYRGSLAKMKSD